MSGIIDFCDELLLHFEEINFGGYENIENMKALENVIKTSHSNDLKGTEALKGTHISSKIKF